MATGSAEGLPVVATVAPLAFLLETVGGDQLEVEVLLPPGRSPHTFEPSPGQLGPLGRALLVLRIGREDLRAEERWLSLLRDRPDPPRLMSVMDYAAAEAAAEASAPGDASDPPVDPHPWLDPEVLKRTADAVAEALGELDPIHGEAYRARAAAFGVRAAEVDTEIRGRLAGSPCRAFLVDHPAWGAFAQLYGLRQLAVESEGKEPSPAALATVLRQAQAAGLVHLWVRPGAPSPGSQAVARSLDLAMVDMDPMAADTLSVLRVAGEQVATGCRQAQEGKQVGKPEGAP